MPLPGSHKYDIRRARLRNALHNSGIPEKRADELANQILRRGGKAWLPRRSGALRYLENLRRRRARKAGAGGG